MQKSNQTNAPRQHSILCQHTNGTFAFATIAQPDPLGKTKRAIFSQRTHNNDVSYCNSQVYPDFIAMKHDLFDKNDQKYNNLSYHCGQV